MKITHDCPFQLDLENGNVVCGKITDYEVPCMDMLDWRACGNYPWKKRKALIAEYENTAKEFDEFFRKELRSDCWTYSCEQRDCCECSIYKDALEEYVNGRKETT